MTCLCETDDLLSQWRGYGDSGGGFSIGFRPDILVAMARRTLAGFHATLGRVLYDETEQFRHIEQMYRVIRTSLTRRIPGMRGEDARNEAQTHSEALLQEIFSYAPFFKQSTFREEQEWRLVAAGSIADNRLNFRPHGLGPVPYIEVRLGHLPTDDTVSSVRIGPRRDHALARRSLEMLFRGRQVQISSSEVTIR